MRARLFFIGILLLSVLPLKTFCQYSLAINVKDQTIYIDGVIIGYYKTNNIDTELTSVVVYNHTHARVAEATYAKGDENWTIATPVDQNIMHLKWNKEYTLESLFKFLVEKKYL